MTGSADISPPYRDYAMRKHAPYSEGTKVFEPLDV
jgi:hypothetical protein